MHRVHVVRVLEAAEPLGVAAVEHEVGGEGDGLDGGAAGGPAAHEHAHLAVGVGEEERVRDALEHARGLVALVGDEEVGVVDRVQAHLLREAEEMDAQSHYDWLELDEAPIPPLQLGLGLGLGLGTRLNALQPHLY